MVLETNVIYDAIELCSENGYIVINETFVGISIIGLICIGFIFGFLVGIKDKKRK